MESSPFTQSPLGVLPLVAAFAGLLALCTNRWAATSVFDMLDTCQRHTCACSFRNICSFSAFLNWESFVFCWIQLMDSRVVSNEFLLYPSSFMIFVCLFVCCCRVFLTRRFFSKEHILLLLFLCACVLCVDFCIKISNKSARCFTFLLLRV